MDDKSQLLSEFVGLTNCSQDQATFWLEANNWNLQTAVAAYMDSAESGEAPGSTAGPAAFSTPSAAPQGASPGVRTSAPQASGSGSRVKSFRDLISKDGDSESEDDDETEKYFAGGEKSGVMMQGGPKKSGPQDLVRNILEKAAKAGPAPDDFNKSEKPRYFGGIGNRLGSEDDQPAGPSSSSVIPSTEPSALEPVERRLTFWRNGFSIDDGPLREFDAPENQEFLRAINSGRAPTSLLNVAYGQPVEVKVAHRMDEDYQAPPKRPAQPFSGTGQRLGGLTSDESVQSEIPGAFPTTSSTPRSAAGPMQPAHTVDASAPVTSIQIRLADGTRLVAKFNHTHTVGDLRRFINASRPGEGTRTYTLQTTFPIKVLGDETATIQDAGLLNAVVVQRYA